MIKGNIEDFYPLSPAQQGILFHSLYQPESGVYFGQLLCVLRGDLNVSAFRNSWQKVVERHPILRTSFLWENLKEPVQAVRKQAALSWQEINWRSLSVSEQQQQLETFLKADREQGFDLKSAPLIRIALAQLEADTFQFILSHHHLVLDGWSLAIVLEEVFAFYQAFSQGEELHLKRPRPYRDYIAWLHQQDLSAAESFWRQTLKGFAAPTAIARCNIVAGNHLESSGEQQVIFSATATATLQSAARQHQLTLNTLVQAAWALLLSRYSGEEDVVFGTVVSGRSPDLIGAESVVGLFVNPLPVRVKINPQDVILSWLKELQAQQVEARQYEYSPLVEVQGWSEVPRSLPLFESFVVFENYPSDASLQEKIHNLKVENIRSLETTNYPLTVMAMPGAELTLKIIFDRSYFEDSAIARMLKHLQTLLEGMAANPHQKLSNLSLLSAAEQQQLLVQWNDTQADYPKNSSIHELFAAQTERTPDAVAAICENEQLTYRELNAKANQIAHYLQTLGVKSEVLVGICLERSLEMLVAILGILKAGAAYVPLDPAYPQERRSFMLADAKVPVLLTQKNLLETLPEHSAKVVCIDAEWQEISRESDRNPAVKVEAENLAYVLYTSGSTGTPKGVLGTHRGTVNRCFWNPYPLIAEDICCQKTSLNFVDSIWEIFAPLLHGLPTVIIPDRAVKDINQFLQTLSKQNVTRLVLVPSLLRAILDSFPDLDRRLPQLKYWICSGETLPMELCQQFREQMPQRVLINLYGSSEVAADVTWYDATHCVEKVPIGRPIANTQIYLLDRNLQPVPIGIPGEIYVGGDGLAKGYLNRPELTSEKFISNPFGPEKLDFVGNSHQKVLFKTGDIGCYLPDGNIEFLGRSDCQVKIRGFRIELGEIEAALSQHSSVSTAAVLLQEKVPGSQRLVAYLVANSEFRNQQPELISELRSFLKHKLPDYMVPSAFVLLDALPLTPNGKIDRLALSQKCDYVSDETAFTEPQTPTEKEIAEIWTALLGLEKVGTNQSFFDLGGHSLMATRLISRVRSCFGVELALCDFFAAPTIQNLAELIEEEILANADSNQIDKLLDILENIDGEEAQTVMLTE
ncbi:amino acid adenylation domain-containing protein [Tychonema sp. LEGE 07199]|uniref:non-ribosomal peptide synthetase n=1 Tax=unclassified Tychonema TaxID=2642144 RepID=UPI00187EA70B|nr:MULTISPECIES: non-ribosomal peptide synthetase [unclassified Tychonema]MBE9120382.1 amino acid adenylation domain-containing protein [Tychonema sp. LEGE 07199]MBE9130456.1 amino acid adenylation domain-containing protein [Tychonema sp. LEGE 07196]